MITLFLYPSRIFYLFNSLSKTELNYLNKRFFPGRHNVNPGFLNTVKLFFNKDNFISQKNNNLVSVRSLNIWRCNKDKVFRDFRLNQNSGIIYVPLVESNSSLLITPSSDLLPQTFLPLIYEEKNYRSGFISLSFKEKELLIECSALGDEFRNLLMILNAKVIYNFANPNFKTLEEVIENGLENVFGAIKDLHLSKELTLLMGNKILPFLQHFIVNFWCDHNIDYSILMNLSEKYGIMCDSYDGYQIKINTFIELFFADKMKKLIENHERYKFICHLVNSDNLIGLPVYFNEVISKDQTGQKHADLLFVENTSKHISQLVKFYYDIKTFTNVGINYRQFSLFQQNTKLLQKLYNDMVISLQRYITLNKNNNISMLKKLYDDLIFNRKTKNISEAYNLMIEAIIPYILYQDYPNLNIGLAIDVGKDPICFEQIKEKLEASKGFNEKIKILFSNVPMIDKNNNQEFFVEIIEKLFPNEIKQDIIHHIKTIIWKNI